MESEVGIVERICGGERFPSVLKLMYQDFHVKEVDLNNIVLRLDELILRSGVAEELKTTRDAQDASYRLIGPEFNFSEPQTTRMKGMMSGEDFAILTEFLQAPICESTPYCVLAGELLNGDKERRKNFHSFIRDEFGSFLTTDTFEEENKRSLRVWVKKFQEQEQRKYKSEFLNARNAPGGRGKKFKPNAEGLSVGVMMKDPWPADRPNYLHFRLYKENRDTAEAIQSIARCLCIPPKSFQFCGTKDRRGITVQAVSVYRVSQEGLRKALLHSSWDKAVRISHLEYSPTPLRIGGAGGNHFTIALRLKKDSLIPTNTQIDSLFTQLQRHGFLNYYGLQRFGNRSVRTHHVGALLLAGDWQGAVDVLLKPEDDPMADDPRSAWRLDYARGDIEQAHSACPSYMYIEKSLLRTLHLSGQRSNYLNAIQALPATTTHMYLHAVQSLVFNAALSERIAKFGNRVVVGDLVAVKGVKRTQSDQDEEEDDGKVDVVKLVETEEEANSLSMDDLVQTLVGSAVDVPPNMAVFYSDFLKSEFTISQQTLTTLPKFLHLRGAYRRMVSRALNLKWEILESVSDSDILIKSDVDVLKAQVALESGQTSLPSPALPTPFPSLYKAVVFECTLNSGCYLTMALREVTEACEKRTQEASDKRSPEDCDKQTQE